MTPKDFEQVMEDRINLIREVLASKGKEYSSDYDRLHNFKVAAAFSGGTPAIALWGMLLKHLVSVQDLVHRQSPPDLDVVNEKIGDTINYLILLEAVFRDKERSTTWVTNYLMRLSKVFKSLVQSLKIFFA